MKIEIKSGEVKVKSGNAKRTGIPYTIREQEAYLHVPGAAYPERCVLNLEDGQEPYAPGIFETANELYVGDFGRLAVSRRMVLTPARKAA